MNKRILRDILCLVFGMVVISAVQWGLPYLPSPVPTSNTTNTKQVAWKATPTDIVCTLQDGTGDYYGVTIEQIENCGPDMKKVTMIKSGWLIAAGTHDINYNHRLEGYSYVRVVYCPEPPFVIAVTDTFVTYRRASK